MIIDHSGQTMLSRTSGDIEQLDDVLNHARKIAQRGHDWERSNTPNFVEEYINQNLKIALRGVNGCARNYGVFEAGPQAHEFQPLRDGEIRRNCYPTDGVNPDQALVFPRHVEIVESAQKVISSTVRFQPAFPGWYRILRRDGPDYRHNMLYEIEQSGDGGPGG
jgi:hypothetical protein